MGKSRLEVSFEGSCDALNASHHLSTTQVQTGKCSRETGKKRCIFMCDSIVHVYRYTVISSYTVTFQRLD